MVRFQAAKVWGIWGMSQEPAAFLLDLSSQLLRPTGWSLGFGPRSLFLRLVCPCHVCCEMQSWLGWSAGGAVAGEGSAVGERRPRGFEWRDRRVGWLWRGAAWPRQMSSAL